MGAFCHTKSFNLQNKLCFFNLDVLAGLIGSFLAQGLSKTDAAKFSVAIHGAAGDKFSRNKRIRGLTATKLIKIINEEML